MELVEVEILTTAITAQYGTLSQGTILRTSSAFAKHLVEDAGAAKYVKKDAKTDAGTEDTGAGAGAGGSAKPSEGLTVPQLKAALEAKGVAIPEGAKKPDLVALLDGPGAAE